MYLQGNFIITINYFQPQKQSHIRIMDSNDSNDGAKAVLLNPSSDITKSNDVTPYGGDFAYGEPVMEHNQVMAKAAVKKRTQSYTNDDDK